MSNDVIRSRVSFCLVIILVEQTQVKLRQDQKVVQKILTGKGQSQLGWPRNGRPGDIIRLQQIGEIIASQQTHAGRSQDKWLRV